jgi:hypothetical protein
MTIDVGELNTDKTEAPDAQISENPFSDFGMAIPAFAQSVPVDSINIGDMIYASKKVMGWIVKKNGKSFKIMKTDGSRTDWVPPKVQMLGFDSGVMVLRSLLNMLPGGQAGLGNMQGMLMPLMMMGGLGGEDNDLKSMLPMILMSQTGTGGTDPNAANPMASMLPMMMMMKMMGGNKGSSGTPFSGNGNKFFKN